MKKILSLLAVAAMAFTACTTDIVEDVVNNDVVEYATPLEFGIETEVSRSFMDDETTVKFEAGDEVGVYVTPADATATATKNAKGTIVMVNGKPRVSVQVASFAAGDKVMAYYPYNTLNNNLEADAITLQIPEIQKQAVLGKLNCKYLPMVSVATNLASENSGTILFRPVASIMKLNIYSDKADYQNSTIKRIVFISEKYENVVGCNYTAGNCPNFDLTAVTEDSEITIDSAKITTSDAKNDAQIQYPCYVIADYNGDECKVGISSNDGDFEPVYLILFPGSFGGQYYDTESAVKFSKIKIYTEEDGRFDVDVKSTYDFKRAMIKPFNINLSKATLKKGGGVDFILEYAVDDTKATKGYIADQLLNEELIVIGSGAENDNMYRPANSAWNAQNYSNNMRTFYAQTLDGAQGFRLWFYSAGRNNLKRGDKIKINMGSIQWFKHPVGDGWEYYGTAFSASNIFKLTPGCEDEIVTKEKHIKDLTPADLNTDVKLLDMEFVHKGSAFVYGQGSMAGKPELAHDIRAHYATMMQDKNGSAIYALINAQCPWKRDLTTGSIIAPQGVGKVHGVLVNQVDRAYGDIGKFQIRPFDEKSFEIPATKADAVNLLVDWVLDKKTVSIGQYKWNGGAAFISGKNTDAESPLNKLHGVHGITDGSAILYPTNRKIMVTHAVGTGIKNNTFANYTYFPTITDGDKGYKANAGHADVKTSSKASGLTYYQDVAAFYEWDANGAWTGGTKGYIMEFPATGVSTEMSVYFSITPSMYARTGNDNVTTKYMYKACLLGHPLIWKVECSVDNGTTWTKCINAINGSEEFRLLPMVNWNTEAGLADPFDVSKKVTLTNNLEFCPGFTQQKFVLPASAKGAAKVMVKISPASLQVAYPTDGTFNATMDKEGKNVTKDYSYPCAIIFDGIAVTYAK
ncbi:MAG: hypothetical protein IJB08_07160 [Alistipes sp.]|nr:hypothetical protein [Alistipes sp.]